MEGKEEARVWGIHARDDALFLQNGVAAIGWKGVGDLTVVGESRDTLRKRYCQVYPDAKKGNVANSVGMLYRFLHEVKIGDYIIFPSKSDRMVNIGRVESNYYHEATAPEYRNRRKVKWLKHFPRTAFSQGALYEIGSALTFFSVKNYADEFLGALDKNFKSKSLGADVEDETVAATAAEIKESTKDFIIKELSRNLKGYDFELFVEDLLKTMGYRTTVSAHGGDGGIDIIAYKDELPPRIAVQVKSKDGDISAAIIQSLKGAMREGDYGLFVTLSNYTKNAQKYLENTPIIRGINGTELTDLILKYYGQMSEKYRKMIPLEMVYIPVAEV